MTVTIYRGERSQLTFASEAGQGGYHDVIDGTTGGTGATTIAHPTNGTYPAGTRSIVVTSVSGFSVGEYVRIGGAASTTTECRKITSIDSTNAALRFDYPLGFPHADTEAVDELSSVATSGTTYNTFIPGVYDSAELPDMLPEITPHYFLGTSAKRTFTAAYRGRQTFRGNVPNFLILNGIPLRFPIGKVCTAGTDSGTGSGTLSTAANKGDIDIVVSDATGYSTSEYIQIGDSVANNAEVRQISAINGTTFTLDYPLMLSHTSGSGQGTLNEVVAPFTHTIDETTELDTISMNALYRDSDGTTANDINRRFVGGMINRATISGEENGMVNMAWSDIYFLDEVHNQQYNSAYGGGSSEIPKFSSSLLKPTASFPTTEPYYFTQGTLTFFGVEFARIRSFSLEIENNAEEKFYFSNSGNVRSPLEMLPGRREYMFRATVGLPDSLAATSTTRTLFKELLLEGNYSGAMQGFAMSLVFDREGDDATDKITINIPSDAAAGTGLDNQGAFIVRAPHNLGDQSPVQIDLEILFRNLQISIIDSVATYP